jgi:hypothetical protein
MGLALSLLSEVLAADPTISDAPRKDPGAPLIGAEAFAVIRFDAAKLDAGALERQLKSAAPDVEERFGEFTAKFKKSLSAFTGAGGRVVIAVFSTADIPLGPVLYIPLKEGANVAALRQIVQELSGGAWRTEKKEIALLAGAPSALAHFNAAKPLARHEVDPAVKAAGDGWLQVLLLPTDDQRRVVDEVLPLVPGFSPETVKTLTQGVRWAALGLDSASTPTARLTLQSADAAAAQKLATLVRGGLAALGNYVLRPAEEKPLGELQPEAYKSAVAALAPEVTGNRVTITLADAEAAKGVLALTAFAAERFESAGWNAGSTNLKRIVLALHNYLDVNKTMPSTAIRSKDGKPLLSWRVAILPYLDQGELYRQFHLDEPWDSDHNKKLIPQMPGIYRSLRSRAKQPGLTTYLAPVGKDVAFTGDVTGRVFPKEFQDGTSNTILLVDAADDRAVVWTQPDDLVVDLKNPKKGLLGHFPGHFLFAMADGSIRLVPRTVSDATLGAAFTVAGGEALGSDW